MNVQVIGCSHHVSSVSIREKLSFSEPQIRDFLERFRQTFPQSEAVLLSTCNRTEFYTAGKSLKQLPTSQQMIEFLASDRGVASGDIAPSLFTHQDQAAIGHLFKVAAALDSMVIGEAQILSQVKQAYQLAVDTGDRVPLTHQVFQSAIRVAKRVATETEIQTMRVSIPSVAVNVLSAEIFERLDNKRILVIGAGEMAEETLTYLIAKGGRDIVVVNRTRDNAIALSEKFNGQVAPWEDLESQIAAADLIVSTTGAREPIVTGRVFEQIIGAGRPQPLLILDLAIPRDFDSTVSEHANVFLYTLDDLQNVVQRNRKSRESQWPKAEKIIDQETTRFFQEAHRRNSGLTIAALKQQANGVKDAELERLLGRLNLSPEEEAEVEQSFHRLVNKILHPPLKSINSQPDHESGGLLDAMKRLFQLGD